MVERRLSGTELPRSCVPDCFPRSPGDMLGERTAFVTRCALLRARATLPDRKIVSNSSGYSRYSTKRASRVRAAARSAAKRDTSRAGWEGRSSGESSLVRVLRLSSSCRRRRIVSSGPSSHSQRAAGSVFSRVWPGSQARAVSLANFATPTMSEARAGSSR